MSTALSLAAHLMAGFDLGLLYFYGLWRNARLFATGAPVGTVIALAAGRFVLLGAVLVPVASEGALPLLATALGIFIARFVSVRRMRGIDDALPRAGEAA